MNHASIRCPVSVVVAALAILSFGPPASVLSAQVIAPTASAADVGLLLRQLDGEKRVLMIGAHPDDEDTAMLAALARGQGVRTAYLSLSRGEGGQNLIGPELDEGLGVVRTGELLSARSLDGAEQFFTRAFDFGFSRSADETFGHWPEEELVRDVVWVVRRFRPHVILSIFSGTAQDGHGQHQASGITARRAFEVSGDPDRFPEQLVDGVEPWAAFEIHQLLRGNLEGATVVVETGRLDPLLGRSHFQVAMEGRSRHRSQDMGAAQTPGARASGGILIAGRDENSRGGEAGFFAVIDTTLAGVVRNANAPEEAALLELVANYRASIRDAWNDLHPGEPDRSVPALRDALNVLEPAALFALHAPEGPGKTELVAVIERRRDTATRALLAAAGVVVDVRADRQRLLPGEEVVVEVLVWNGGTQNVVVDLAELSLPTGWDALPTIGSSVGPTPQETSAGAVEISPGDVGRWTFEVAVPESAEPSRPYYLREERLGALYEWPADAQWRGRPGDPSLIEGRVVVRVAQSPPLVVVRDAMHIEVDKAEGERRAPVFVVPPVSVEMEPATAAWPSDQSDPRPLTVRVSNLSSAPLTGALELLAPEGWEAIPTHHSLSSVPAGGEAVATFRVRPLSEFRGEDLVTFRAVVSIDRVAYDEGLVVIDYPHLDPTPMLRPAQLTVSRFPVQITRGVSVGYVMGPGDGGLQALRDMGVVVESLGPEQLRSGDLDRFDTIVLGARAYETRTDLIASNDRLLAFAERGGTVVVQYNKYEYPDGDFAPYPISMARPHDRVTDPEAPVTFLVPDHPALNAPNVIADEDFSGWIQERGLYFLSQWDERYTPLLAMGDPGLPVNHGSLVVAPVGEGVYVYTGMALFRQFPAGVPGAFRILANLVSLRGSDL